MYINSCANFEYVWLRSGCFFCQFVVAFIVEKIHVRAHVYHCVAVSISTCHVFLISHNFICSAKILF
jgi:hypothetical protein